MNRLHQAAFTSICWMTAVSALAAGADSTPNSVIVCHSPVATREIRTYLTGNGGCRVDYLKDGNASTLWSASTDRAFCAARARGLADKLARGNFQCTTSSTAATDAADDAPPSAVRDRPAGSPSLTATQIIAANQWLQKRVESSSRNEAVRTGPEVKRYTQKPDFLAAADVNADGKTDLVLAWGWSSFRCDGTYLTVLINEADNARPSYRAAEATLPSHCGAKGWLASVKDVKAQRIYIDLQQRYPGSNNIQEISATLHHDGTFAFYGPDGRPGSLAAIEKALPMRYE